MQKFKCKEHGWNFLLSCITNLSDKTAFIGSISDAK